MITNQFFQSVPDIWQGRIKTNTGEFQAGIILLQRFFDFIETPAKRFT